MSESHTIELPKELVIHNASEEFMKMKEKLLAVKTEALEIDGSQLEKIDSSGAQILIYLCTFNPKSKMLGINKDIQESLSRLGINLECLRLQETQLSQ